MNSTGGHAVSRPLALFVFRAGARIDDELAVGKPVASIGQGGQNDIVIDDDSVSTRHAQLEYTDGFWRLTDLGSTNGTHVEGVRLAPEVPTPLQYGASVRFGGVRMQFRAAEDVGQADLDAASAAHVGEPARVLTPTTSRVRIPVWVVALIIVLALLGAGLFVSMRDAPAPADAPVPTETAEPAPTDEAGS